MTTPTHTRDDVAFDVDGTRCAAWLYRPRAATTPPVVVMAHGFGGTRRLRLGAYAERFAEAGLAVLLFDYRGWGDSDGEPRRVLSIRGQQEDWRGAIAFARAVPGVDGGRVVAWGTSFAGGHVLHLASEDRGLAAVVAQVPHVSGPVAARATPPRLAVRLGAAALRDVLRATRGRAPHRVPAVGPPGSVAMMTSPDAWPQSLRLAAEDPERFLAENEVAARIALQLPRYSPGRRARRIVAPTLVQIAEHDVITPARVTGRVARRIPRAEVRAYACGHFEPYLDPWFDEVVGDQLAFLRRVLGDPVAPVGVGSVAAVASPAPQNA